MNMFLTYRIIFLIKRKKLSRYKLYNGAILTS